MRVEASAINSNDKEFPFLFSELGIANVISLSVNRDIHSMYKILGMK